jgi:hypothetical protein
LQKTRLLAMPDCNSEKYMIATTVCTQLQKKSNENKEQEKMDV